MTDEGKGDTEKWIESKGAKYPYAYDKGGKIRGFFGITGIPHSVLIDATGTVVWRGHPGNLTKDVVEKSLAGALTEPLWAWPDSARKVRQAVQKRQFAKALDEARALGADGAKIAAALEALVQGRLSALKAAADAGDWFSVEERGKSLEKEFSGLPAVEEIKALLARLKDDRQAQAVLAAQKEIRRLTAGRIKKGDIPRIEKRLGEIAAQFPATGAARDAERALADLKK